MIDIIIKEKTIDPIGENRKKICKKMNKFAIHKTSGVLLLIQFDLSFTFQIVISEIEN